MVSSSESEKAPVADFRLAEWLVQPSLNRLSCDDRVVQIEPKQMDVLVFLAGTAGEVVSKQQIMDAVWPDLFITESVISRAIAGLRRALGDDAKRPRFIETILKRGYRLIAEVAPQPTTVTARIPGSAPPPKFAAGPSTPSLPYVVGQWVRGDAFYGRRMQIDEILAGNRNWLWLLGTRRIGKTSLLKQLEHLAVASPEHGFFPVFWDLQGADRPDDLHSDFSEALLDTEERLHGAGIRLDEVRSDELFESLGRLRRALRGANLRLLLLCDEVEELIHLNRDDPALLRKLRRAMQSREGVRSVLASSSRLWQLAEEGGDTSPFLDGFTPPLYLGALTDEEARELIRQTGLPTASQPEFSDLDVERIRSSCGNHPYLMQLVCRRAVDLGDLEGAIEQVSTDRSVGFFFSVDFELLSVTDRAVLRLLAERSELSHDTLRDELAEHAALAASLDVLLRLGLIGERSGGGFHITNEFFRRWLRENDDSG
jgi:DNA-binding winged helix-turn-helix (wHTH) protein